MKASVHNDAGDLLEVAGAWLETAEALNALMLDLAGSMQENAHGMV